MYVSVLSWLVKLLKLDTFIYFMCEQYWNLFPDELQKSQSKYFKYKHILPDTPINKLFCDQTKSFIRPSYIEIGESKTVLPTSYLKIADEIRNFEVRDTDVWVLSYPKSGSTWTLELVRMVLNGMNVEDGKEILFNKFHYIEFESMVNNPLTDMLIWLFNLPFIRLFVPISLMPHLRRAKEDKSNPRLLRTHLHWELLPKALTEGKTKAKIVIVHRNTKDVICSRYHFQKVMYNFNGTFEDYCKLFLADKTIYAPYWSLVHSYLEQNDNPNVCTLKFEEMKKNMDASIRKVSKFLDRPLSENQISALQDHLSFEKMKKNKSCNHDTIFNVLEVLFGTKGRFMRRGEIGSYKLDMNAEQEKLIDKWVDENTNGKELPISFK